MSHQAAWKALRALRISGRIRRSRAAAGLGALLGVLAVAGGLDAAPPPAEPLQAIESPGPPGVLWGRLAVEEESPAGPWTPLNRVEVQLYPAPPALLAELEKIRDSVRNSGAEFDQAVARVQAALAPYRPREERVPRAERDVDAPTPSPMDRTRRQLTNAEGLFVFEELPPGDWLLVAIRVRPYGQGAAPAAPHHRTPASKQQGGFSADQRFLPSSTPPAKEAEIWLKAVHIGAGTRTGLTLTDRARWLVGPVR